jgi:hypothetical protein
MQLEQKILNLTLSLINVLYMCVYFYRVYQVIGEMLGEDDSIQTKSQQSMQVSRWRKIGQNSNQDRSNVKFVLLPPSFDMFFVYACFRSHHFLSFFSVFLLSRRHCRVLCACVFGGL